MKRITLLLTLIAFLSLSIKAQKRIGAKEIPSIEQIKADRSMLGKSVYKVFIKDDKEVNRINYESLIQIGFRDSKVSQIRIIEKDQGIKKVVWDLEVTGQEENEYGIVMLCENANQDQFFVVMRPIANYSNIWKKSGGDIVFIQIENDILNVGYIMEEVDKEFMDDFMKN